MWNLEIRRSPGVVFATNPSQDGNLEITLHIAYPNFREYLQNKLIQYPIYLCSNYSWFRFHRPHDIKLEPEASDKGRSIALTVENVIRLALPTTYRHQQQIVKQVYECLLSWVEEEYDLYQKEWKDSINYS